MTKENEEIELVTDNEDEEDEVYIEYDIATYPSDFTLSSLYATWKEGDIEIPSFQRSYVWSIKQASLLIESFLLGLPVPPVFFYEDDETAKSLIIDGQQRITSIAYFFEGFWGVESSQGKRKVFRLTGLSPKSPYYKKTYLELTPEDQRKFSKSVLRALNVKQISPKKDNTSIYHIFERLNTGGTPLRAQEIRNCVFRGDMIENLRELNKLESWRLILGKSEADKYQKDIELILRVFSLSKFGGIKYESPMKEHLNKAMAEHKNADTSGWSSFKQNFPKVCQYIVNTLGEKPFHVRGPLNVSVMDSIMSNLINREEYPSENFETNFKNLVSNEQYFLATQKSTSHTNVVEERFAMVRQHILE